MGHNTRVWYLSYNQEAKAQASLRMRAVSPEPSLLTHKKYRSRSLIRPNTWSVALLGSFARALKETTERMRDMYIISWAGQNLNMISFWCSIPREGLNVQEYRIQIIY